MVALAFGCSHTQGAYLPDADRWPDLFSELSGLTVENLGYGEMGLFEILDIARSVEGVPEFVVLQKPIINRYPWYCKPEEYRSLGASRTARTQFNCLPDFAKKVVLKDIFRAECKLLEEFGNIFSESPIVFWHYWYDHFRYCPAEFVEYNHRYESYVADLGMKNLGTIWTPSDLSWKESPSRTGEFTEFCVAQKMIVGMSDGHPLRRHNIKVAERVKTAYEEMVL